MRKKVQVDKISSLEGHKDCIYTIEKSVHHHQLYSGAGDGMVVVWDLSDPDLGKLVAKLPASVYAIHLFESENKLLVGQNFSGIHKIDPEEKKEIGSIKMTDGAIFDIKSYKDKIIAGDGNGTITTLQYEPLKVLNQFRASEKSARTIAVNPVNREYAVGFSDNTIRIYDLQSDKLKKEISAHKNSVFTLRYTPDFKYLLSGSRDAHLKFWDTENDYQLKEDIVAHMYTINHIDFDPQGNYFVSCSMDKSIKVWDAHQWKLLKVIDKARHAGHGTSVNKLYWTAFNNQLVSASDDRTLSVWDLNFLDAQ